MCEGHTKNLAEQNDWDNNVHHETIHLLPVLLVLFTARPEAQRCQVTPYVVNVVAAAAGEGKRTL